MFDKKVFSSRLRAKRAELDLTQAALAEMSGLSSSAIVQYEDDGNAGHIPGADKVWALSEALGCTPGWLIGWDAA